MMRRVDEEPLPGVMADFAGQTIHYHADSLGRIVRIEGTIAACPSPWCRAEARRARDRRIV